MGSKPPFDYRTVAAGRWRAKVEIENTVKKESNSVTVSFKAVKADKKVRADVSAVLGVHVASVVIDDGRYQAVLIKRKEFREGQGEKQVIPKDVFGVEIDLKILPALLFDEAINSVGWVCLNDGKGLLLKCENQQSQLLIEVSDRRGIDKRVTLSGNGYSMIFKFDHFAPLENISEKTFNLPVPKGFKRL
jgi:hypothetical protein